MCYGEIHTRLIGLCVLKMSQSSDARCKLVTIAVRAVRTLPPFIGTYCLLFKVHNCYSNKVNATFKIGSPYVMNRCIVFLRYRYADVVDDNGKSITGAEKEAEVYLQYLYKFENLMKESKYEEAVQLAVNSPRGILCTVATMQRFKSNARPSYDVE